MRAQPEPQGAAFRGGQLPQPGDPLADLRGRFAPGQVHVGAAGGDGQRRRGRAAEVQRRHRVRHRVGGGAAQPVVLAVEVGRFPRPDGAQRGEELVGALVAAVVVQPVAVAALLGRLAAGDDVEQQPAAGDLLVGCLLYTSPSPRD